MIRPRIRVLPAALGTRGPELVELAGRLGYELDDWQKLVVNDFLSVVGDDLAAFENVLLVGRQNGKSVIGELYAVFHALAGESALFTSHRADSSREIFRRLLMSLPEDLGAEARRVNGAEQIVFPGGGCVLFRTRGPRVGRGFTFSKLIVDECQITDRDSLDAMLPTLRTREDAQVLYLGCAPNARVSEHGQVLHELRTRARAGGGDSLCYLEWSADPGTDDDGVELQAGELAEAMLDDVALWEQASPGLERGRISIDRMRKEREAMDGTSFAIECLSVGIWPDGSGAGKGPVGLEAWRELVDEESEIPDRRPSEISEVVVGFDMSATRRVSVCVAGRRDDGLLHLDLVGRYEGMTAAVAAISAITGRDDVDVRAIVCGGEPQNMDLLAQLERVYVPVRVLRREGASQVGVQACAALIDLVGEARFRHRGQIELDDALRGAVVKTFSDSWAYSRSRSRSDVSPLLAAACALWCAAAELEAEGAAVAIY